MTQFIVNKTQSYTLIASAESGNVALVLSEDLRKQITEIGADPTDPAVILEALGRDAAAYLDAMDALYGLDGLADAYAAGGMDGLASHLKDLASAATEGFGSEHFDNHPNSKNLPDGFESQTGTDLADMLDFGLPGREGPADKSGSDGAGDDDAAAIEALLASQSHLMEGDEDSNFDRVLESGAKGAAGGAVVGAVLGSVSPDPVTTLGGAAVGGIIGGLLGMAKEGAEIVKEQLDFDNTMPVGPDNEGRLTKAEFFEKVGDKLDPLNPDPETTMPADPDGEFRPAVGPDEDDLDNLDETTQPGVPENEDEYRPELVDASDPMGLDPLINPGNGDDPDFEFVDGFSAPDAGGGLGGNGHDFAVAQVGSLSVQASSEAVLGDATHYDTGGGLTNDALHSPDDMIFM